MRKLEAQLKQFQQHLSPNKTENALAQSAHEAQELREKMRDITDENEWLQDTVNKLKRQNQALNDKLAELDDLQNSVIYTQNENNRASLRNPASGKTETFAHQSEPMRSESPEARPNIFRGKISDEEKPVGRNIFGLARELVANGALDDNHSDYYKPQRSPQNPNVKLSSKQEHFNTGRNLEINDLELDSPPQQNNQRRNQGRPHASQKTELMGKENGRMPVARSPEEKLFSSPDYYNRNYDSRYEKSNSRYHGASESENEQDPMKIKGEQVITEIYVLKELRVRLDTASAGNSLYQYKISCLKQKSLLFENDALQIGATASLVQDYASSKNLLKLMLYYGNKLNSDITSFRVSLTEGLNLNVVAKPQAVETTIARSKQAKQQLLISYNAVPFSSLQLNFEGLFGGSYAIHSVPLPNLLVKFIEFKYVEGDEFSYKWRGLEDETVKTEPIQLDSALIKSAYDFKNYFSYLVDLKPKDEYEFVQGKKGIKFGGLLELDTPNVDYLLKIHVLPNNEVVFQVATQRHYHAVARYLLQTLVFIFRR